MKKAGAYGAGSAVMIALAVTAASEGITPGVKTTWTGVAADPAHDAALAHALQQHSLSNKRLLAYAARMPPPQSWYDNDEELF
jgi:hypothetical protein